VDAVSVTLPLLIGLIAIALLFDFLNGLHDAANSIATIVSTRVLSPQYAVFWAAFFNFIAFLFFGLHVAETIGKGIVEANVIDPFVVFGALVGAITWNVITWIGGIPSSSSHALVGGLVGAGVTKAGGVSIVWQGVLKTASGIVLSPAVGFALAVVLVVMLTWRSHGPPRIWWTATFALSSLSRLPCTRWGTARMMPRRRWASSRSYFFPRAISGASSTFRSG
jgi:PiT family inorganic phosphate transporter